MASMYAQTIATPQSQVIDSVQMNHFRSFVNMLGDPSAKDEIKLKAAQELSEHFELITQCSSYPSFLEHSMRIFLKILQDAEPHFISELNLQQVRKLILEMIHRLPTSEFIKPYVKPIIVLTIKLLQTDNEENVLVCLRIIIDMHKQYRPSFHPEIQDFLSYVKSIYSDLPKHLTTMFEPKQSIRVKDLKEINFEALLPETFAITPIQVEKKTADGKLSTVTYNLIPKGVNSLKVLQELPIIVVLMYQIYKTNVHQEVVDFVPLIITTITLQPSPIHKSSSAFNKEIYVDFMGAQIKTLAFSAYIIRLFQDVILTHAPTMVKGMLNLLESCPKEVAHLRKELLVATRHILATELRNHFVSSIDKLFDEDVLLGKGWTTHESLRPLAYSTLADLVHHVRQHLSLPALAKAVYLFAKNVHDESLPTSIQTMSCKLLLNLVECIRIKSDVEPVASRELLITMLKVFTQKFHTISKLQLPQIMQKWKNFKPEVNSTIPGTPNVSQNNQAPGATPQHNPQTPTGSESGTTTTPKDFLGMDLSDNSFKLTSIGFPQPNNLNVTEYRSLVKTLVCGVKTITWGCPAAKLTSNEHSMPASKLFNPSEILIFIDLFHWALEALDIYTINVPTMGLSPSIPQQKQALQIPRSKEEKEVLEHFSGVFLTMDSQNFQEIFASTIDFMVDRLYKNSALQVIANSFLANPKTSPLFATVLVEYLLERMEEMGSNIERSNLYLRLFKLVFGSVSLFAAENEHMLRPHLHNIVNRSMELAMTAKEPYNYFLLLRALFRSIGGGSHDLLYQEFLPLLPNLLEGLNRLQSGFHKQHMKDLFVELCLTVPVRLSSLLPYLPMLMDPLVSALNGSHTLVSQGLRTLELCVDNLQPDFLYDHIQPVRADLMQALWRTLRNQDSAAVVAFRVLGKFGGGNRKMMIEPQQLMYHESDMVQPAVIAFFQEHRKSIDFPVDKVIETAFNALKTSTTDPFYWRQSWEVIRCYLASSICLDDDKHTLQKLFMHPSFTENNIITNGHHYTLQDKQARQTHQTALTGMFVAAATKELRGSVLPTMVAVVRHYTMVAIAQQAGPFPHRHHQLNTGLDPLVLIDALAAIMGHEEKELCKPGNLAMVLILETATNIMGSKERACRLPMMQYLAEKMAALCYERPWYSKMGGCIALKFLYQNMAMRWLYQHLFIFLKAFMFIIMDLTGEVSSGAIDMAKNYLEKMLKICMTPLDRDCKNEELITTQKKAMYDVIHELVRQVTSPHTLVRETAMSSLRLIAELQSKTVTEVMNPHREVLVDMIPPKKHLLRHQPASAQIGLMDGNTFCTTLDPRLFTIDLNILTHKVFYHEVLTLSDAEDTTLNKLDCYKTVTNLIPLRKSALRALAACHYIPNGCREKIFSILFKALEKNNVELQEAAFECMQNFLQGCTVDKEAIHAGIRPLLMQLGDHRNLTLNGAKRLSYLTQLFPSMFNEKLCDSLLQIVKKLLESSIAANKGTNFLATSKTGETEQKIVTIIGIFHQIPAASAKFIDSLCKLILQTEKSLMIEPCSPYRSPLVKFLLKFPKETMELMLSDANVKDPQWNRFMIFLVKHKDGLPFRNAIQEKSQRLIQLILINMEGSIAITQGKPYEERYEAQRQAVLLIHILTEFDSPWISTQSEIITALKSVWRNDLYKTCQSSVVCDIWHLVAKILIEYFSHNTNEIPLLFQLLRALCLRFIPDFQFFRDFLQNTVCQSYTVDWKRKAFFHFVECFVNQEVTQDLKAKILTMIIIPSFAVSFEKGEGNKLVGAPPSPYQEDDNNVVSVFINKVIDPEKPFANEDSVRIALLQFACLLVERASPHIHDGDANNKREGNKLRRLMTFAWPCLLPKNCVDPAARYHGHLLLSHIIARLAIHKRIVLQVFHSLLKAHAVEARTVVKQALEVLTPAMPLRMEDGNTMLTHWTKKIIVEEGHSMQQLFHILQLLVRHFKVYYPVRHHLVQQIVNSMHRLGFTVNATIDYRKLSVELAEVIIKWEIQRIKEEAEGTIEDEDSKIQNDSKPQISGAIKRTAQEEDTRKKVAIGETIPQPSPGTSTTSTSIVSPKVEGSTRPIDRAHCDAVLNFLFRMACQLNDVSTTPGTISPGESLSRRCVTLLKLAMKPDMWQQPFDLKLTWLDKVFTSIEGQQPNIGNVCTALELLTFLLTVLKKDQILVTFRPLQRGLSACVTSPNTRVIKLMHGLLTRLMAIFPTDSHHKHDEMETLYATISKMIFEGLATYEKNPQANPSTLFGTLMTLKAACTNNQSYIDRLIIPFMRLLNRLTKEHLGGVAGNTNGNGEATNNAGSIALELLVVSLDLVKNRVVVMSVEMRKMFIGGILVGLIEKSNDVKVIKAIVKMIEEWMKNKNTPVTVSQAPTLREKSILLVKLMQYVEKRFTDDQELNGQFLELVNYIYRDEQLKITELTSKLEAAFLAGLRCNQPKIRAKFFEIFDGSMRRRLHDRLLYIICSHAWDSIGQHYWIKQCIELLILTANTNKQIQNSNENHLLPSISSVINFAESDEKKNFVIYTSLQNDPAETFDPIEDKEDAFDMDMSVDSNISRHEESERPVANRQAALAKLISRQAEFLEASRKVRTEQLLVATAQLCHMDTVLAEKVWLDVFPRLWSILDQGQQQSLDREIVPFLSSGTHIIQKDCHPSALHTFVEALSHCNPTVSIPPNLMAYLGKAHNLWHRMTLELEEMTLDWPNRKEGISEFSEFEEEHSRDGSYVMDPLSQMYSSLHEEDLWAGLWLKYAKYPETNLAIAHEQMGFFEEAQSIYDTAMTRFKQDLNNGLIPIDMNSEILLWENHWIRCAKELNQWDILMDYGQLSKDKNSFLIMDSAWRVPDWTLMKQALLKVEQSCPKQVGYKVNLYRGYLTILNQEEQHPSSVERYVEMASAYCMREWRRLPPVVSHIHLPILQASQQIMELQEASQIHQGLLQNRSSSLHDMKAIVKTWRNRLPVIADDLSHWSDIFTWRQHHYQIITSHLEQQGDSNAPCMLGAHASAQTIIHFGKIARKQNLTGVCQDSLYRIYTIPSVPVVDCFQKIRQQVKCCLQMAAVNSRSELSEALEVIEPTNLDYFSKEMTAEFYALKGLLLAQTGRSEEANKAFSAATQLHDTLIKAWALWGDYLEHIFTRDPRQINLGVSAMTCFLHACRNQNESKSRKYLAKVLWILSYDEDKSLLDALDKYAVGVPPIQWVPWIPQLLCCLVQYEGTVILNLLSQVGRMFPQAVYFPIRTLYLTLKIEQRERYKSVEQAAAAQKMIINKTEANTPAGGQVTVSTQPGGSGIQQQLQSTANVTPNQLSSENQQNTSGATLQVATTPIRATPPMWRCSKIMHLQRDIHPTVLSSLEGIVDQMVWFRENWYEEVLRQLRQGLTKCYAIAFENRCSVNEATITQHTLNFVKKLVSTFGIGIENISSSVSSNFSSAASESLARRAQATVQDPVFQKMKGQFTSDFDFSQPGATKLHNLINKLKIWIKILENKTKQLPKSFLIEEKCRFLSNFSQKTAEVELPGELLLPKHSHYHIRIARFMPRVDIVQKHNTAARRLYIRGTNGKIYPYLVVNDTGLGDARREERVLQLLRMLNNYFAKQKETSKRFLHITVPRVVAVSPQMRLVEDNPSSISLLDIYKTGCAKLNIEHDAPIARYYERLAKVQARGSQTSHTVLRDIFREVQATMIPKTILKDWAVRNFCSASDYWQFRKMFTLQLSLSCLMEYAFYLTRLNADMMYLHQDSGLMNVSYFKFDVDDNSGLLDVNRPIPFRLTPNIVEFLSTIGVSGPATASTVATARCLVQPNFKLPTILRAILRDEIIAVQKKRILDEKLIDQNTDLLQENPVIEIDSETVINIVNKAVSNIMARLNCLARFDNSEVNRMSTLVQIASNPDNLCRMDPTWHPWL
ncbi:transcription-associated protein 1 isoform X1 [Malaya genurostris]|uniref:transcription-associated protein 1 isoform X1 n=2 Tax=Malaya genurostris TaxID=325434 RepID=UPI0026F3A766|nr:transcription-associated protein 1 isoform X1 [Malaya genurostris]XP_058465655.1 transcription-associated protein 1 isoform X1 [Malaya genurostris]XP_058465656.1 transcription-associated protein 1 isoform X1 [Malaya genurostris]